MIKSNIFGSCVSRDAVSFTNDMMVRKYFARQSLVSATSQPLSKNLINEIKFKDNTHEFYKRVIMEDVLKTTLKQLEEIPGDEIVIIDYIEERMPLGITKCGSIISLSQAALKFSNVADLCVDRVQPYSNEYIKLFIEKLNNFTSALAGTCVIVHKALYAPGVWSSEKENETLSRFYDLTVKALDRPLVVEVPQEIRISSQQHKWGSAPYHYIDEYYADFVKKISNALGKHLFPNKTTMQLAVNE